MTRQVVLDPRSDPGANLTHAGPLAMSEHWDCLRHDSAWSTVLWISEWPRIDVPADFLHPLVFAPGVRRSLQLDRPAPAHRRRPAPDPQGKDRRGRRHGPKAQGRPDRRPLRRPGVRGPLSRERTSIIAGHTDVEFSGFVTVTAANREGPRRGPIGQISRAAAQAACEVRPLYGRQAQGFVVAALPLARRSF